jgi:integrase
LQAYDINNNNMIKTAVRAIKLDEQKGFPPESVSSHSLRASGAMAMHLNNIDHDKIREQARWSSDTFLMYIHEHISAFSAGLSAQEVSKEIGWFNIDCPCATRPQMA